MMMCCVSVRHQVFFRNLVVWVRMEAGEVMGFLLRPLHSIGRHCNRKNWSYKGRDYACNDEVNVWISNIERRCNHIYNSSDHAKNYVYD